MRKWAWIYIVMMFFAVIHAQRNSRVVLGAHIEWRGLREPRIELKEATRTIILTIKSNRECVTVYSPPSQLDYTMIIRTPNGKISAVRPHINGFQGSFCYNLVGDDQILRTRILLGKATFRSANGDEGILEVGKPVNIVVPATGRIRYLADVKKKGGTQKNTGFVEEGYNRFPPVYPEYEGPASNILARKTPEEEPVVKKVPQKKEEKKEIELKKPEIQKSHNAKKL